MKKLLAVIGLVGFVAAGVVIGQVAYVSIWSDHTGLHIGAKATDKVAFRNATPVGKQIITNTAPVLIQVVDVAGVTNTIACYTTTNQLNQVRNAIVAHGLASTDGN